MSKSIKLRRTCRFETRASASAGAFFVYNRSVGDLNTDRHWSRMDIADLRWQARFGDSIAEIAAFLRRTEAEVREKAKQLGLTVTEERRTLRSLSGSRALTSVRAERSGKIQKRAHPKEE